MLIIYGGRGGRSRVEELGETAQGLEGDARLGGDPGGAADSLVQHPGGDLKGTSLIPVEAAVEDRLPVSHALVKDVDLPAVPVMERIADRTDIDQRGLVLRSSRLCF
jgi:hypothetical protein